MAAWSAKEIIEFRIPGDPERVRIVRKAVLCIAKSLGFSDEVASDIELSVAEAVTNSVEHGSPRSRRNVVVVVCKAGSDRLVVDIEDEGPGFEMPRRNCRFELLDDRGRGLRLIQRLMDKVQVRRTGSGCRITMAKKRNGDTPQLQTAV